MIVSNDGSDPINGTFNGLPEGATFTTAHVEYQITYTGGSGNDVALTVTGELVDLTGIPVLGRMGLIVLAALLALVAVRLLAR